MRGFECDICKKNRIMPSTADLITINFHEYYLCSDCMWHFREMWGKLLEERRKETEK